MNRVMVSMAFIAALVAFLAGCARDEAPDLPGTVEWDRVAVLAETVEPVREIRVKEGDVVKTGDILLLLDTRRTDAELAAITAERNVARAQLQALRNGARRESLDAARAETARVKAEADNAASQRDRVATLFAQGLVAQADVDRTVAAADAAAAALRAAEARSSELRHGSRQEDIDAGMARVAALDARVQSLALAREKLTVVAPRDGRVDALPFRVGDQPVPGASAGQPARRRCCRTCACMCPPRCAHALAPGATVFSDGWKAWPSPSPARLRSVRSDVGVHALLRAGGR
jgi:HlyD family secretion protein